MRTQRGEVDVWLNKILDSGDGLYPISASSSNTGERLFNDFMSGHGGCMKMFGIADEIELGKVYGTEIIGPNSFLMERKVEARKTDAKSPRRRYKSGTRSRLYADVYKDQRSKTFDARQDCILQCVQRPNSTMQPLPDLIHML